MLLEALRVAGAVLLLWILPGFGWLRLLARRRVAPADWPHALWLTPAVLGAVGLLAHSLSIAPRALLFGVAIGGWAAWLWPLRQRNAGPVLRPSVWLLPLAIGIASAIWLSPEQLGFSSDVYAHVAAMRATLEESRVFPEHEFYPAAQATGPDPRFGTLHAAYAALGDVAGLTPLRSWHLATSLGVCSFLGGVALLAQALLRGARARWFAILLALAAYGGSYYNLFRVGAFPLWFALGPLWGGMALWWWREREGGATWLSLLLLATLPAHHALAGIFAAVLLGTAMLAMGSRALTCARRSLWIWLALLLCFASRFQIAYGDVNPIHHRPWEVMLWPGLGYAARPSFVFAWLGPLGLLALCLAAWRTRAWWKEVPRRWLLLLSALSLLVLVPPLLPALMPLLGFLPLRFVMLIFFPWLLAFWIEERPGRWWVLPTLLFLCLLCGMRLSGRWERPEGGSTVRDPEFAAVVAALAASQGAEPPVVLSDPFTMLALRASAPCAIVAVPDGRSSPRDADAIDRLRDSWRALACASDAEELAAVARRYNVTHVVWNGAFGGDLQSYEYPVHRASLAAQRARLDALSPWLRAIVRGERLVLYAIDATAPTAAATAVCACVEPSAGDSARVELRDGYWLSDTTLSLSSDNAGANWLQIEGHLGAEGAELADRRLFVRLDHVDSTNSDFGPLQKPLRKLRERLSGERRRHRFDVLPRGGRCPTWTLEEEGVLPLELRLRLPSDLAAGAYRVTIQIADFSVFTVLGPRDFLFDDDVYSGPVLGQVQLASPRAAS